MEYHEKLFKSKHPFILVQRKKNNKKFIYKTFRELDLIDESYDNEPDDVKRMLMIIKETERLASLSGEELEDWLRKAQSICEFNFNLLWSKQDFYHRLNY